MSLLNKVVATVKERPKATLVLPEGRDERVLIAASRIRDMGLASPIVLGSPEQIAEARQKAGVNLDGVTVINPREHDKIESYAQSYAQRRDLELNAARRLIKKPLFCGGMMLASGDADAMVAGAVSATALVIQAGVLTVGYAPGVETASSYFVMVMPHWRDQTDKLFIYADCAVNVDPTAQQLADIAIASADSAANLLDEPVRVAMLSASTQGSISHPRVAKVTEALTMARQRRPELSIDGEFQADTAIHPGVAAKKLKQTSEVAGWANVLIFPDLDSGNIAYKLTQRLAGAQAVGPLLQGFAKPISDLSRGASVDDIVAVSAFTLTQRSVGRCTVG